MTEPSRTALKKLQQMDLRIQEADRRVQGFDPKFEEVEEPALILESDAEKTRSRLQEMKLEERRLELSLEEKKARQERLEERLGSVRNLREEAAVSAELEMVKRALQSDEQEAYSLLDQIRKLEDRLTEVEEALEEARGLVEPALAELVTARDAAKSELARLQDEREQFVGGMNPAEVKLYDGIRRGGRSIAVSELTEDGACGNCFGVVPLQLQNEVRGGDALIRCEACGVILTAADPNAPKPEEVVDADQGPEAVEAVAEADEEVEAGADATDAGDEPADDADAGDEADAGAEEDVEEAAADETPAPPPVSAAQAAQAIVAAAAAEADGADADADADAEEAVKE